MITPVRRSVRHFDKVDYQPSLDRDVPDEMPSEDRIHTLLEEHDFAYAPNPVSY